MSRQSLILPRLTSAIRTESRSLQLALVAAVVAALVGFIVFRAGGVPLFGDWSVGVVAAVVGGLTGTAGFVAAYLGALGPLPPRGSVRLRVARRVLDTSALALNHTAIWLIVSLGGFSLLQLGFAGLKLDTLTATTLLSVAVAVATYFMQASGSSITAFRVSSLLSIFIVTGILASMITAPDHEWWKRNFSDLGTMEGFSGFAFNFTLIATGSLVVTLADYVTADIRRWALARGSYDRVKVGVLGWSLVGLGLCLACVGIFPVDRFLALHNSVATGMVLIFVWLVLAIHRLVPGFPVTFFLLGYSFLVAIVVVTILFFPVGYYNLTALELVAAAAILGWVVILIRTVAAHGQDVDDAVDAAEPRRALR